MEDKRKALYDALAGEYDLGTYEDFNEKLNDENKRRALYDAAGQDYNLGTYEEYSEKLGFGPSGSNVVPMFDDEPQPTPAQENVEENSRKLRGLWANFKESSKGLWAGIKGYAGEQLNMFTGSSREEQAALNDIERLEEQGVDVIQYLADKEDAEFQESYGMSKDEFMALDKKERKNLVRQASKIMLDQQTMMSDAELKEQRRQQTNQQAVEDAFYKALEMAGGDLTKAKAILREQAADKTKGDILIEEATETMNNLRQPEGFAGWVGNLLPQMVPSAVSIALNYMTKGKASGLSKALGYGTMGGLTLSTAGMSMIEARNAGATNLEVWTTGIADGAIEIISEKIPFDRVTKRVFSSAKANVAEKLGDAVLTPKGRKELEKLLSDANEKLGGKLFSKKNVGEWLTDTAYEAAGEFTAEALQTITTMIYENPEDYPTISEVLANGWEGAKAGLFMGSVTGGASLAASHAMNKDRRQTQGYVDVAQIENENGDVEVVEVVGENPEDGTVTILHGDTVEDVSRDKIGDRFRFSYEEFENGRLRSREDDAIDNGVVNDGQIRGMEETIQRDLEELQNFFTAEEINQIASGTIPANASAEGVAAARRYMDDVQRIDDLHAAKAEQDQKRKDACRDRIESEVGQRFWVQEEGEDDGSGFVPVTETVEEVVYADGRVGYVVGSDETGNLTMVYNDGSRGFSTRAEIAEKESSGEVLSNTVMGLDDYLAVKVDIEDATAEAARMEEEQIANVQSVQAAHPVGSTINVGTAEAKVEVPIIAVNAEGAIVQMPDGTTPQLTWADIAHAEGQEVKPKTNAELDQEVVDEYKVAYQPAVKTGQEPSFTEKEVEVEQTTPANPLPLKADGSVDQTALWNNDPERWAQWNDEQRQDGGANTLAYVNGAIAKEQAKIAELQAAYAAESDFDARDAIEKEIADTQARVERLGAIRRGYIATAEAAPVVEAEPAAPRRAQQMREQEIEELNSRNERRLRVTSDETDRAKIIESYLDKISEGSVPIVYLTVDNYEEVMKKNGCGPRTIASVKYAVDHGKRVGGFMSNDRVFIMTANISSIEEARVTYVHERQHVFTRSSDIVERILATGVKYEELQEWVRKFAKDDFYDSFGPEVLADELVSFAMEKAYTYEDFSVALQELGVDESIIAIIKSINDEQQFSESLSQARRRERLHPHAVGDYQRGSSAYEGNSNEISSRLLGQQDDGTARDGYGRARFGEEGAGEGAEVNPEGPSFRVTSEMDADYRNAIEQGDEEIARQMVNAAAEEWAKESKVRDEHGNLAVQYHGSRNFGFTVFNTDPKTQNLGAHFGTKEAAKVFDVKGDRTYKVFLNIVNPWVPSLEDFWTNEDQVYAAAVADLANELAQAGNEEAAQIYKEVVAEYPMAENDKTLNEWYLLDDRGDTYTGAENLHPKLRRLLEIGGYDGVRYNNWYEDAGNDSWVALYPEQIKSAEVATFDDDNKLIPLSERFTDNVDLRFRTAATNPEVNLTDETRKELADKGLVMDGGAIMSEEYSDLKNALGYETPIERNTDLDQVRFSVGTKNAHIANYRKHPNFEERVVEILERLAERMTMNELVYGVVSTATQHTYGKKLPGSVAGPLRSNEEYIITFDLDTSCPRTFQYLNLVKQIEKRIGRPLTQVESIQLIEMMRMYGQQIPCVYCYAENKRQALKQYYTDFMEARHGVLSAASDEEALQYMYGRVKDSEDPREALTKAAYEVFVEWRKNPKGMYNPTIKMMWNQYTNDRNSILSLLDRMYADKAIGTSTSDTKITGYVAAEFGVTNAKALRVIEEVVAEWKWDVIEEKEHDQYTPVDEDDWAVNEKALEVWRDMTSYAKSASSAKSVIRYTPYTDELKAISQEDKDYINGMGGVRMHSSNDFRIDYVFDYFQFMADMALYKMFGHTYTKSPEFVRIFGNSGYKINMSIAAYQDENGNIRPNADEGFDWEEAKTLRQLFPNAGTMLMATSDEQIQMALDSDWIDMCIPFHHSGLPKAVWYNMRMWQDYTSIQKELFLNSSEMKEALKADGVMIPKNAKADDIAKLYNDHFGIKVLYDKKGKRIRPHFLPGPTVVDGHPIPGHNNDHQRYLDLCKEYGVKPRFAGMQVRDNSPEGGGRVIDVTEHPRYMIFIKETSRTDSPQTPIQFNFDQPSEALGGKSPIDYAFDELEARAMAESEIEGKVVNDIYNSLKKDQFGIADQFINSIIKHKNETGEDYPLDYITPESRDWFLVQRKALEEAFKDVETIPYHRNEYDEQGNLTEGKGLERDEVIDLIEEAKKAQKKHEAKTKKEDIRFRTSITPEQDAAYLKAVEAGDMETAQRMVLEAAKIAMPDTKVVDEDGNPKVVYHGTPNEFWSFDKDKIGSTNDSGFWGEGFYFTSQEALAFHYAEGGRVLPVFLNIRNPHDFVFLTKEYYDHLERFGMFGDKDFSSSRITEELTKEGKDGVIRRDSYDGHAEYVVFSPSQIKSAEPVTYDNDGNVIPLSERFNPENADIRFRTVRTDEQREQLFDNAKEKFGLTNNFKVAGYMLPDGSLLDFSEANDGGDPNQRTQDHREVADLIMDEGREYEYRYEYVLDFVSEGAIRMLPEYAGFQLSVPPTAEQRSRLMDYIYKHDGEVIMEITDENGGPRVYMEYNKRTSPSRIFRDMDGFFNEGIVPGIPPLRFRIANDNQAIFVSNAARAVEGIKMEKATPEQWLKMIEKNGGLKAGEDKWMGLSDWLKASDKKTLTKQEVLDFINEHMIIIEETHYTADAEDDAASRHDLLEQRVNERYKEILNSLQDIEDYDERRFKAFNLLQEELGEFADNVDLERYGVYLTFPYEDLADYIEFADMFGVDIKLDNPIHDTRLAYTTPGLNNHHEIALTVPTIESWNESDGVHFGDAGDGRAVAWIRFGETWERRPSPQISRKVLVIDEIQSKRHQEGREKGYAAITTEQFIARMNDKYGTKYYGWQDKATPEELDEYRSFLNTIPDAPFDKNWHELAMKRMLRYAAENGYDVVAWTTGDQQADRYDLSRDVKKISASKPTKDGERIVNIYYRDEYNDFKNLVVDKEGKVVQGDYSGNALADVIGKEMALQIMKAEESTEFKGEGLKIGGEGMRGFYDKMLPAFMNKYGKKWGVKVEDIDLPNLGKSGRTMHSVPVTEEMKASVMEGQVMFRTRGKEESAMDFHQSVVEEHLRRYNDIAAMEVFPVDEATANRFGYTVEQLKKLSGLYDLAEDLIAIFAKEDETDSIEVEDTIFHESIHKLVGFFDHLKEVGEWMWSVADKYKVFADLKKHIEQEYSEDEYAEEMMCCMLGYVMPRGLADSLLQGMPERIRKNCEQIFYEIGYDRTRESIARLQQYVNKPSSVSGMASEASREDEGRRRSEKRTLTAEERRIINEYFPGAFPDSIEQVRQDVDQNPTEAQKNAGNYKMGHIRLDGYNITIENPKGSVRRGTDSKGNAWENTLNNDYGYIRGTEGVDGDHIDVYLSDNPTEGNVFVIDQVNPETREFDEHKVMYGFNSAEEAREAYLANFSEGWNGLGTITEVSKDEFKKWIESSHRKTKPFSEYKSVRANEMQATDESELRYRVVSDQETLDRLNSEPTIKVYRAMQLIDGKLYPPMSAKVDGELRQPIELGQWEEAEERPDLVDEKGRFKLDKGNKSSLKARYNPYFHTSLTPLNDQFSSAQTRPELVTVEVEVPESELTSGYKAEKAKDSVGKMEWKAGVVQSKLSGTRTVVLSRWDKPVRIVPDSEVADVIVDMFEGRDITMPSNVVTPSLRVELEKRGVPFVETDNQGNPVEEASFRVIGTPTDELVTNGLQLTPAQTAEVAANIFAALPEESRKKITEGLNGDILGLKDAILQIPTSLASKENWNDEDKQVANVVAEEMTKIAGEMTRPFSAEEGLWLLYNDLNKGTDLISQASRALVQRNLGFDAETLAKQEQAKEDVRFRTVGDATSNAQASLYNRGAVNVWTRLKESFVDMQASVEELVKAIEKRTGKVAQGFENILLALNQQSSKGLAAMESYTQKFLNPMFDEIRRIMDETKMKYEDVVRYVILKHGLERNKKLAQRDARAHYQEIYDDIISKITGMTAAQKRTYLTNAQLKEGDAKAELAVLKAVDMSAMTDEEKREHKKKLAAARKVVEEAEEYLKRAQKIASMSEQEAQDELDKIFEKIENGTDSVFKEMRENDYSGISSMFYDQLGVDRNKYQTEEEYQSALMAAKADMYNTLADIEGAAQTEVDLFERQVDTKELWKRINAATKETLRQQYEANMISKDQYLNLRDMFEYYVPLRGFKDNTAEDMYTYYRKPNSTGYTKPILGAEGRKTEAESPFGWIAAMAGSAIASNVKNEAKLALYYFVSNRPENGIATISKTWFVDSGEVDERGKKIFKPAYPPFSEDLSSDAAKANYEAWQENMRELQKKGQAYEAGQRLNLGNAVVNISDANKPEHIVNVKVGGKDYTIIINGNPRAAQAINGDLNIEGTAQDYSALFGPVLRWMSSVNTSYNPEFWITNMMRDMAFTMMAVNIKEDPAYRRKFKKNYLKAFKVISLVAKNEKGTIGDSYLEQQYKDFVKYGGVTGYTQIKDSETWEHEIENYLSSTDPESLKSGKVMRGMKSAFHAAHRFGESLEQVSRFAAFLTARETGKSINESIDDAKEITVNFNRKGSGKMITLEEAKYLTGKNGQPLTKPQQWMVVGLSSIAPLGRRFIMFFNAAIQGLNATYKLMKKNPKRFTGWALGYAAVGMMNAVLHAMLDDDDDYLDIPQYERRNSLMIGGNGAYFKWALPQEARAFYALGDLAVETVMGRNPHQNFLGEALKIGTEILPVNPSEGWKAFMPSVAIPFIELALNEDYKGAPIYNDQKWLSEEEKERTAKWSNAYQGTGWTYVKIAQGLNFITGGDKHDAGLINLQPEKLEHLVQSAFGGTIRTADKFINTISAAIDPEEPNTVRQAPFLNRFLTINDERFKNVHVNDVFDYYKADAEHALTLEKQYIKDRDMDSLTELRSSDEYQWAKIYGKYKKPLKAIQDKIKVADGTAEKKELMKQQDELKKRMIKEISEL